MYSETVEEAQRILTEQFGHAEGFSIKSLVLNAPSIETHIPEIEVIN